MNTITITSTQLIVEPMGIDKAFAFKSKLEVPLSHVRGAAFDPGFNHEPKGIRAPGLAIPGKWAGTFIQLVLTVDNPQEVVTAIHKLISEKQEK